MENICHYSFSLTFIEMIYVRMVTYYRVCKCALQTYNSDVIFFIIS